MNTKGSVKAHINQKITNSKPDINNETLICLTLHKNCISSDIMPRPHNSAFKVTKIRSLLKCQCCFTFIFTVASKRDLNCKPITIVLGTHPRKLQ